MQIDLPGDEGGNVISIKIAQHTSRYARRLFQECEHSRVEVDVTLTHLTCLDCKQPVNPMQWISMMVEEWHRIKRMTDEYRKQAERVEERSKVKCRHCGKLTPLSR